MILCGQWLRQIAGIDGNSRTVCYGDVRQFKQLLPAMPGRQCGKSVGADAFSALPAWHRWQQLFELAHIAVAHRPGVSVDTRNLPQPLAAEYHRRICLTPQELTASPSGRIISLAMTPLAISATQIRALLAARRSPRYLLPDAVIAYIDSRHLYTGH